MSDVERVQCGNPDAIACYDFENAKKLRKLIANLIDYRDTVEARCPRSAERADDETD
jgi:hypothetical protein